jgi:hypothetical protein
VVIESVGLCVGVFVFGLFAFLLGLAVVPLLGFSRAVRDSL